MDQTAPTARTIIARGKREARRPWYRKINGPALKGRNIISALQALTGFGGGCNQGRRASRLPLAIISRAVGALVVKATSQRLNRAPFALFPLLSFRLGVDEVVHHHDINFANIIWSGCDVAARDSHACDAGVGKNNSEKRKTTISGRRRYETAE